MVKQTGFIHSNLALQRDLCILPGVVIIRLALQLLASGPSDTLWPASALPAFQAASRLSLSGHYAQADSVATALERTLRREGSLLHATVDLTAFSDLHESARLESARARLSSLDKELSDPKSARERFFAVLVLSQQSYLATLESSSLSAALSGRKAATLAQDLVDEGYQNSELQGILGGYWFWKAQTLGALAGAFGGDTRDKGLDWTTRAASSHSPYREVFRTSLLWMRFERKEYAAALGVVQAARATLPENRLLRQAEGDILFRQNRFAEALETYRTSFLEYRGLEPLPANRLAAAGNLARIHEAMGHADSARSWIDTVDAPRYAKVRKWLPPSLVRELEPVRKRLKQR
ncbi:MAG: hypothetical protein IPK50_01345 [Fibrobacterota bacterium]|nr:MAG: hypothetical protein IPK50_01345 [Fibrobacterota bacterium]